MAPIFVGGRRILGSLASDPTTGLAAGDQYYNTTDNKVKFYDGSDWQEIGGGSATSTWNPPNVRSIYSAHRNGCAWQWLGLANKKNTKSKHVKPNGRAPRLAQGQQAQRLRAAASECPPFFSFYRLGATQPPPGQKKKRYHEESFHG